MTPNADFGSLQSGEVCDLTGASYRQLDYWARSGIITPEATTDKKGHGRPTGSGSVRWWKRTQLPTIRALVVVSDVITGNHAGPSQLLRAVGQASSPRGPYVLEHEEVRITVQMLARERSAS